MRAYEKIIADYFGEIPQLIKTVEELAELQQAITKYLNNPIDDKLENIIEEIADVEIMISQLEYLLDIRLLDVNKIKEQKYLRTMKFINKKGDK